MNRAERRRAARQVAKGEINLTDTPRSKLMPSAIKLADGRVFTDIEKYLEAMEDMVAKKAGDAAAQLLYDSEIYICAANMIIMLYAMKMTVGNLKTVQRKMNDIVGNYNAASNYVDRIGIRKAYEELNRDFGVKLEFDDVDLDWIWEKDSDIAKRFKLRIGEKGEE